MSFPRRIDERRWIEASAERHGDRLRCRARLCQDDLMLVAHRQHYALTSDYTMADATEDFAWESGQLAGMFLAPLFRIFECPAD